MLSTEEMDSELVGTPSTAFLNKLWKIVNDPSTNDLIKWSPKGTSFIITNQMRFSQELIPKYFKHNNMASFVRQLNMYGFRKVVSVESGGLVVDKGEMEFSHKQFVRGQPGLIENIKRKPQTPRTVVNPEGDHTISNVLSDLKKLKMSQEEMETKWIGIKKENELLWREYANMRQKFSKQQQIIEKLVQFLLALVKSPGQTITPKRKFNHLALECIGGDGSQPATSSFSQDSIDFDSGNMLPISGPVIHEMTHSENDAKPLCLEKVVQNAPKTPLISAKPLASNARSLHKPTVNAIGGRRSDVTVNPGDSFLNCTIPGNSSKRLGKQSSFPSSQVIVGGNDVTSSIMPSENLIFEGDTNYPSDLQPCVDENDFINESITVESPNGTVLDSGISSIDQDLDSDLLQVVDPSVVNPNIVVNIPNQSAEMSRVQLPSSPNFYPSYSNSSARKSRGKGIGKKAGGKYFAGSQGKAASIPPQTISYSRGNAAPVPSQTIYSRGKATPVPAQAVYSRGKATPVPAQTISYSRGKGTPVPAQTIALSRGKKKSLNSDTKLVPFSKLLDNDNAASSQPVGVIPDNSLINKNDLSNHLDEVQNSLESFQDILNSSNFNVDTSTILSLFGDDNSSYLPDQDNLAPYPDVVGNEVSVYNPTLYNTVDDDLFPSIFLESEESTPKRPRLEFKKERKDSEIDDVLSTPCPQDSNEEPSFMQKFI